MKVPYLGAIGVVFAGSLVFAGSSMAHGAKEILESVENDAERTDITGKILTNTSSDCADYASTYWSDIEDLQQNRPLKGAVIITVEDDHCILESNGIPNHDVGGGSRRNFVAEVSAVGQAFKIPRNPQFSGTVERLMQTSYNAVMLNGTVVDVLSAACYRPEGPGADRNGNVGQGCRTDEPWLVDPMAELSTLDTDDHHAHTQPDGRYHYHGNPEALFNDNPGPDGSPVIGFAADGFPIFGTFFKDENGTVRKAMSGYTLKEGVRPTGEGNPGGTYDGLYIEDYEFTGAGDLDECNGMTVNGVYGYYVTDSYPWIIACLRGWRDSSFDKPVPASSVSGRKPASSPDRQQ